MIREFLNNSGTMKFRSLISTDFHNLISVSPSFESTNSNIILSISYRIESFIGMLMTTEV